jgi:hypothetical protein
VKVRHLSYAAALLTLSAPWNVASAFASNQATDCKTWPTRTSELVEVLAKRAVGAASLSSTASERDKTKFDALVSREAQFNLGAGDVGRPLGNGAEGFRKLIDELKPERYRFDGWDYMSSTEDPCASHEVTVEFTSQKEGHRADVKFRFFNGRIVEAKGWLRSMTTGVFPASQKDR